MRLDARTKLLNPKWYEGMLSSGYEGVREIQKRLTNTMGWSATSGQVIPLFPLLQHQKRRPPSLSIPGGTKSAAAGAIPGNFVVVNSRGSPPFMQSHRCKGTQAGHAGFPEKLDQCVSCLFGSYQ